MSSLAESYSRMSSLFHDHPLDREFKLRCGLISESHYASKYIVNTNTVSRLGKRTVLKHHQGCVNCLEWNINGNLLLSGSDDRKVCIWDPVEAKMMLSYDTQHSGNVFSVKFMPHWNDELIISGAACSSIQVQHIQRLPQPMHVIRSHRGRLKRLATAPKEHNLFWSAAEDGTVREFDLRTLSGTQQIHLTNNCLLTGEALRMEAKCIAVNPVQTELVAVGWSDAAVRVFDRRYVTTSRPFVFTSEGQGEVDERLRYFSPHYLNHSRHFSDHLVTYVSWNNDGTELLANNAGEAVFIYDIRRSSNPFSNSEKNHLSNLIVDSVIFPKTRQSSAKMSMNEESTSKQDETCEPPPAKVRSTDSQEEDPSGSSTSSSGTTWFNRRRQGSENERLLTMEELNSIVREELLVVGVHQSGNDETDSVLYPMSVAWLFYDDVQSVSVTAPCDHCVPSMPICSHLQRIRNVLQLILVGESGRRKLKENLRNNEPITLAVEEISAAIADIIKSYNWWRTDFSRGGVSPWTIEEYFEKNIIYEESMAFKRLLMRLYLLRSQLLLLRNWRCDSIPAYQNCVRAYQLYHECYGSTHTRVTYQESSNRDCIIDNAEKKPCPWLYRHVLLTAAVICCVTDMTPEDEFPPVWKEFERLFRAHGSDSVQLSENETDYTQIARSPLSERLLTLKKQEGIRQRRRRERRLHNWKKHFNCETMEDPLVALYGSVNTMTDIKEANFFGCDGQYVVAGSDDGCVYIWNRYSGNVERLISADSSIVNVVQPHPWDCVLASSGLENVISLWDLHPEDYEEPSEIPNHRAHFEENLRRRQFSTSLGLGDLNLQFVPTVVFRGDGDEQSDDEEDDTASEGGEDGHSSRGLHEALWWRDFPQLLGFITTGRDASSAGNQDSSNQSNASSTSQTTNSNDSSSAPTTSQTSAPRAERPAVIFYPLNFMSLLLNQAEEAASRRRNPSTTETNQSNQESSSHHSPPPAPDENEEDTPD